MIETIDLKQNERLGITDDYYAFSLYIPTGEIIRFKNYSCTAILEKYLLERYNLNHWNSYKVLKIFHNGTNENLNLDNVYKKYHKYFKEVV